MTNYCTIGKFVATYGLKGELVLQHHLDAKTTLKGLKALFIEIQKEELLPYFIQSVQAKSGNELIVKLEEIDNKEAAQKLTQKQIWLPEADFQKFTSQATPISFLGYTLIDDGNVVGTIVEVFEQPHQVLCRVQIQDKDALIPLHEETLDGIDNRKKEIYVTLPDGLLDLYLK